MSRCSQPAATNGAPYGRGGKGTKTPFEKNLMWSITLLMPTENNISFCLLNGMEDLPSVTGAGFLSAQGGRTCM